MKLDKRDSEDLYKILMNMDLTPISQKTRILKSEEQENKNQEIEYSYPPGFYTHIYDSKSTLYSYPSELDGWDSSQGSPDNERRN